MAGCECGKVEAKTLGERRTLRTALVLNATMFIVGIVAGTIAQSNGLIADALDMLADATAYAIALFAIGRSADFKIAAARSSGIILMLLGLGVLGDAIRRAMFGSSPEGAIMIGVAALSLAVNATVLKLLSRYRSKQDVHIRASYIFTRADVVANIAVICSGVLLLFVHFRFMDLIVGVAIGVYVMREAWEVLHEAGEAEEAGGTKA